MKSKKNSLENVELGSLGYGGSKIPFHIHGILIGKVLTYLEIQVQTHCWITERGGESVIEQFNHIIQVLYQ
jgi:hypothetical protein